MFNKSYNLFSIAWSVIAIITVITCTYISNPPTLIAFATVIGVIFVLGVAFGKAWTNLLGALMALIYSVLSYQNGYFGNAAINLFIIFPLQVAAYFIWARTGDERKALSVKGKSIFLSFTTAGIIAALFTTYHFHSAMWIHDAVSAVLVITATVLLTLKTKEQWYAWIPYNFIEVLMWFTAMSLNPDMIAIFAMRVVFFVNSMIGCYSWFSKK